MTTIISTDFSRILNPSNVCTKTLRNNRQEKQAFEQERARLKAEIAKDKAERKARGGKLSSKLGVDGYKPAAAQGVYGGPSAGGNAAGGAAAPDATADTQEPQVRVFF